LVDDVDEFSADDSEDSSAFHEGSPVPDHIYGSSITNQYGFHASVVHDRARFKQVRCLDALQRR
jgi:hypothetical protein